MQEKQLCYTKATANASFAESVPQDRPIEHSSKIIAHDQGT
jgi:hypothetical protein